MKHPFVLKLNYAFQTIESLYLIVDLVNGGDLFYHIKKKGHFSEKAAKFYGAQLILGLEYLHKNNILYRDLKPENILLDSEGYIKMADFGVSKKLCCENERTLSIIGTPQYLAPEFYRVQKEGYSINVDVWSLGCCLYEIVVGSPPFGDFSKQKIKKHILTSEVKMKDYFSKQFTNLLEGLLKKDPNKRLTLEQAKKHKFFADLNWDDLLAKKIKPPFKPNINSELDLKFFDKKFHSQDVLMTFSNANTSLISANHEDFNDFSYNIDI